MEQVFTALGWGLDLSGRNTDRLCWNFLAEPENYQAFQETFCHSPHKPGIYQEFSFYRSKDVFRLPSRLLDLVIYNPKYGFPDRLLLVPGDQHKAWVQKGNLLTSVQASLYTAQQPLQKAWTPLNTPLPPYTGYLVKSYSKAVGTFLDQVSEPTESESVPAIPWQFMTLLSILNLWKPGESLQEVFLSLRPVLYSFAYVPEPVPDDFSLSSPSWIP